MNGKWLGVWVLAACIGGSGCAAMSSGAATEAGVKYIFGDLQGTLTVDVQRVYEVASDVVEGMGLRVEKTGVTEIDGEIVAYTARDKKVHLRIDAFEDEEQPEMKSKLSIRIGQLIAAAHCLCKRHRKAAFA